ncbi:MAG: heavy metal-responsive transcriptional regulator [Gemmatimonadales bacterium]
MPAPYRTIGTLARQAGVHVQTLRYYETRGLLEPSQRRASGYREYGPEALRRLQFIRRAQSLGFTLAEIRDLLALRRSPDTTADVVKARAGEKIRAVEEKLHDLTRIRNSLVHLAGRCSGGHVPVDNCPLLDALDTIGTLDSECAVCGGSRVGDPDAPGAGAPGVPATAAAAAAGAGR